MIFAHDDVMLIDDHDDSDNDLRDDDIILSHNYDVLLCRCGAI